jgi:hypothetical protein
VSGDGRVQGMPSDPALLARARVDRIRTGVTAVLDDLVESWRARDWVALGYGSWDAMCDAEFGARIALPKDQRQGVVEGLAGEGMSTRAIGSALGVGQRTVVRDQAGESE